ncbi:TPA: hypothetical protein MEA72_004553 [Klebsiella aerogenes]|nr:hypothetical protein [Klebsiella aerogenes]
MTGTEEGKLSNNDKKVIVAILKIYTLKCCDNNHTTSNHIWVSTREIAEACDINIYRARYSLLKLKSRGEVIQQPTRHKTHGWQPTKRLHN